MTYMRFNITDELRKVSRGRKSKVDADTLLRLIVDDYLKLCADDSAMWLERLYSLEDHRI